MKKQKRFFVVAVLILSLLIMSGPRDVVNAGNFTSASDLISDSDLSATASHTISLTFTNGIGSGAWLRIDFKDNFNNISNGNVTCPSGGTASTTDVTGFSIVDCTGVNIPQGSSTVMTITGVTNPATAGDYDVDIYTLATTTKAQIDYSNIKVYILDDVDVTASVPATLTFTVSGTTTGAVINTVPTTGTSATTSLAFGVLDTTKQTLGQTLKVTTNASAGYTVTVAQAQNLQTGGSSDIDPLWGATSTAIGWTAPVPVLTDEKTWGHFGITGTDMGLGADEYRSLDSVSANSPVESVTVMSHNGPADGSTAGIGRAEVAYSIQVSNLQEAGDYATTMTYVCTPTY